MYIIYIWFYLFRMAKYKRTPREDFELGAIIGLVLGVSGSSIPFIIKKVKRERLRNKQNYLKQKLENKKLLTS